MNKRGSHVGMMISFIVFVTFLIFVRIIFEPAINSVDTKEKFIEGIENKILENISEETLITTISVVSPATCVSITSFISGFNGYEGIVIKDENGNVVSNSISPSDSDTLQIERTSSTLDFLKIYSSDGFDSSQEESLSCTALVEDSTYYVRATKRKTYVFEERMESLVSNYDNYESFKKNLNLPNDTEISVELELGNGTIMGTTQKNITANIYTRESSVEYIDSNANVLSGKLRVKIW